MARKKVAYRKKRQNRLSMFLVSFVVLAIVIVVAVRSMQLREKIANYETRETELETQIKDEEDRAEEIEEFGKYTQTKKYAEEVAKDKLGLVYEGEILFQEGN